MRERTHYASVWLNDAEHSRLQKLSVQSGLSVGALLRSMIMQQEIKTRPPNVLPDLLHELSKTGNNINQIARVANTNRHITPEAIAEIKQMQSAIWRRVKNL